MNALFTSKWRLFGVQLCTACTSSRPSSAFQSSKTLVIPNCAASSLARGKSIDAMATTLTPGTRRRASTWAAPMKPEPMTATLTGGICAWQRNGKKIWNWGTPTGGAEAPQGGAINDLELGHSDRRREVPRSAHGARQRERNVSGARPRAQPRVLARDLNGLALALRPSHVAVNMTRQDQSWATA